MRLKRPGQKRFRYTAIASLPPKYTSVFFAFDGAHDPGGADLHGQAALLAGVHRALRRAVAREHMERDVGPDKAGADQRDADAGLVYLGAQRIKETVQDEPNLPTTLVTTTRCPAPRASIGGSTAFVKAMAPK